MITATTTKRFWIGPINEYEGRFPSEITIQPHFSHIKLLKCTETFEKKYLHFTGKNVRFYLLKLDAQRW